jgi:hypothetical protein
MSASSIPFIVSGGVVPVTGAAMGIGRRFALRAAREGAVDRARGFVGGKVFGIYSTMDTFSGRGVKAGNR